jgi:hypothetical protein
VHQHAPLRHLVWHTLAVAPLDGCRGTDHPYN